MPKLCRARVPFLPEEKEFTEGNRPREALTIEVVSRVDDTVASADESTHLFIIMLIHICIQPTLGHAYAARRECASASLPKRGSMGLRTAEAATSMPDVA